MRVVYAKQEPPKGWKHALFLAGPTPRDELTPSWRPDALELIEAAGKSQGLVGDDLVVFVPEHEDGQWQGSYQDQVDWEKMGLEMADKIIFWVPRDLRTMPSFTTNVEFGRWVDSGKVVLGFPEGAPKNRYLEWLAGDVAVNAPVVNSLGETVELAFAQVWDETRSDGERWVPSVIAKTPMFQSWYKQLQEVGNRLDKAEVLWTFQLKGNVFSYIMHVDIWVASEGRHKANEFIFARTDVACVVLYAKAAEMMDSKVILVREFRSPARTEDGFIHELPGGGCEAADDGAKERAATEVYEETGIAIGTDRLRYVGSRQALGTISTHEVHCYAVELTNAELAQAAAVAASGEAHGEDGPEGEEQAFTEVTTLREILQGEYTDWTTLGLVARALLNPNT